MDTIEETEISVAWRNAIRAVEKRKCSPLVVHLHSLDTGTTFDDLIFRGKLNGALSMDGLPSVETVANTIFPQSLWNPKRDAPHLYDLYLRIWPHLQRCPNNKNGTYFKRLIDYEEHNQLEHIVNYWRAGRWRRSELQAIIFDPAKDWTFSPYREFPCLQQITIIPLGPKGREGCQIVGVYASQLIYKKAYGNYLGLCRLGNFLARQMGLRLTEMTCIAAQAQIDKKTDGLKSLLAHWED